MGRTIGVDLGTTNTAVAVFQKGRPKVIEDDKGYKVLPSVVSMREDGSFVVGQLAKSLVLTAPDRTVYAAKRLIGRRFDSPEVQEARKHLPYTIEEGPDGLCRMKVGDKLMTPVEISAIVLQVAKQIAERAIGETVDEVVITVPAYFNHGQRAATMEAARLAGLRCERLLNEPTAAALAFGHRKDLDRNILIYDLGGGTFDVSVLHVSDGIYEVLATDGDTYLGGEDFDQRVVAWLAERFLRQKRVDLRKDRIALQRLKEAAEIAKCELSFQDKARILVPRITAKDNLEDTITRTQLEEQVNDLVERTLNVVRGAVAAAGLQLKDIDDIVLVGGQTRMPRVREAVSGLFGKEPNRNVHPEEVVATGAAIHAESLGNPEAKPALLIDVTPFDLGIDSVGGLFARIIERNSNIPATRTRTFTTARDRTACASPCARAAATRPSRTSSWASLTSRACAPRHEWSPSSTSPSGSTPTACSR
ncbi:MAG: molecular chaperone DnaK [Pseudomonadota bacterium]